LPSTSWGGRRPVLLVEDPDVEAPVEVGVPFGALSHAVDVEDVLVVTAVLVGVRLLLRDLLVRVVDELDGGAARGRRRRHGERERDEKGPG
jgi:hypothetical protein